MRAPAPGRARVSYIKRDRVRARVCTPAHTHAPAHPTDTLAQTNRSSNPRKRTVCAPHGNIFQKTNRTLTRPSLRFSGAYGPLKSIYVFRKNNLDFHTFRRIFHRKPRSEGDPSASGITPRIPSLRGYGHRPSGSPLRSSQVHPARPIRGKGGSPPSWSQRRSP